ncbi:MAG: hypothetical protein E7384_02985 [Ruminococcaceae bacterium]|nr:hypothetical protein [Oscillospiraceae bacterium]
MKEISLLSGIDDLKNLDVEKFIELYKENMYSAEKTAALLPVVLYAAATSNPDAEKILGFITGSDLTKSEDVDEIAHIKCQIDGKPYIALSYYTCTTPENEYRLLDNPITRIKDTGNFYNEDDEKTLYIACSGSGSYRPIRLKPLTPRMVKKSANEYIKDLSVDDTIWLFDEFSSTLVNVKTK